MKSLLVTLSLSAVISGVALSAPALSPIPIGKIVGKIGANNEVKTDLKSFIHEGSISGGTVTTENLGPLSLLKFTKNSLGQNLEQLSFVLGDKNGAQLSEPGFFQVALDEDGTRLVVDLAQVQQTSVDQADFKKILNESSLIRSAEITMDPVDKSTNITFQMKRPVIAKAVAEHANGKVIIQLQEAK